MGMSLVRITHHDNAQFLGRFLLVTPFLSINQLSPTSAKQGTNSLLVAL